MKKLFVLLVGVVAVLCMSMMVSAQHLVDIEQVGPTNFVSTLQAGVDHTINGYQNAGISNDLIGIQDGGSNHVMNINTVNTSGMNDVTVIEEDGGATDSKNVTLDMDAGINNIADIDMSLAGDLTNLVVNQDADLAAGSNSFGALITGATNIGSNTVVHQDAPMGDNIADIIENLDYSDAVVSELNIFQSTGVGMNEAYVNSSTAVGSGGPNLLTDASPAGAIGTPGDPSFQSSTSGDNYLEWVCDMGNNEFGLYQNSPGNNYAYTQQFNGNNVLACWQNGPGNNSLESFQGGGMSATIIQNAISGDNIAVIYQP